MKAPILLVIIVALVLVGLDGLYVVNEAEQAIVTQFGKPVGDVSEPGRGRRRQPVYLRSGSFTVSAG